MKKLVLVIATFAISFSTFTAGAQGKYGADSAECIKYLSYYKEYFKQKNYEEAIPNWRKAYTLCPPTANQTMLIDGTSLMRNLINKNRKNTIYKNALIDTLMTLHDTRAQYYPKYKITAMNNKVIDMSNYVKNDPQKLYDVCKEVIATNKSKVKASAFLFELNSAVELYKSGVLDAEQVINDYNEAIDYLDQIKAAELAKGKNSNVDEIIGGVETVFISSRVASCDNLIALFTPRYEADPENIVLAKNIVKMMNSAEDCVDNDLYLAAVNTMHKLEPSYNSAYALFRLYSSKDQYDLAYKFMKEAIDYEESDTMTDAQYYYELAVYSFKSGKSAKAFDAALKAAELDESLAGKAYMLCGSIWGSLSCGGDEIEKRAHFWVAVDYLNKAIKADESLSESAGALIRQYSIYYPQTAEAFMYNLTDGQSYTCSCNGLRAVTTVRTHKN